jgi:hypothetical protein
MEFRDSVGDGGIEDGWGLLETHRRACGLSPDGVTGLYPAAWDVVPLSFDDLGFFEPDCP